MVQRRVPTAREPTQRAFKVPTTSGLRVSFFNGRTVFWPAQKIYRTTKNIKHYIRNYQKLQTQNTKKAQKKVGQSISEIGKSIEDQSKLKRAIEKPKKKEPKKKQPKTI